MEVTVPAVDAPLVRRVAAMLRHGGDEAEALRQVLRPVVQMPPASSGAELLAFFRDSPLVGADIRVGRDKTSGRQADLD